MGSRIGSLTRACRCRILNPLAVCVGHGLLVERLDDRIPVLASFAQEHHLAPLMVVDGTSDDGDLELPILDLLYNGFDLGVLT